MDFKIFQRQLQENPSEEEFIQWQRIFRTFLSKANLSESENLEALLALVPARIFMTIECCKDLEEAMAVLNQRFVKQSSSIFFRFKLRQLKQEPSESIDDFLVKLRLAARKCSTPALSSEDHQTIFAEGS